MSEQNTEEFAKRIKKIFIEEAIEFIDELESNSVFLDKEKNFDLIPPILGEIFRLVHSLKAGLGTVGFEKLAKFVHDFESVLDDINNKRIELAPDLIDSLFDITGVVIKDVNSVIANDADISDYKTHKLFDYLSEDAKQTKPVMESTPSSDGEKNNYFQVVMRLDDGLLQTGTDPLLFFNEISNVGDIINTSLREENLPSFDDYQFDKLYLSWEIIVKTKEDHAAISDVFIFVSGKSDIKIEDITARYSDDGHEKLVAEKRIGDMLVERGKISDEAAIEAASGQERLGEILVKEKKVSEKDVKKALDDQDSARQKVSATVRVEIGKLDQLVNLVGELVIAESRLRTLSTNIGDNNLRRELVSKCDETARIIDDLQKGVMGTRMVPVDTLFSQFYRMVRDLSMKQGKNIRLVLSGQETELDKNIIEKINNPMKHIVRNSIDHGIESPDERAAAGKSAEAIIHLKAYQREGGIFLAISDDGKGLDKDVIFKKAVEKGLLNKDDPVTDDEIYNMIFNPGFSTAQVVTDISGRGVGMDVVKKALTDLRGKIEITTEKGKGTTLTIRLPLTLAIIEGLLFKVGHQTFVLPLLSVEETFRPAQHQVKTIESRGEVVDVRGRTNALIRIYEILELKDAVTNVEEGMVLTINVNHRMYSLLVDDIIGQQQIVLKSLEDNYEKVDGFSGATILGDGSIATILEPEELVAIYKNTATKTISKNKTGVMQ